MRAGRKNGRTGVALEVTQRRCLKQPRGQIAYHNRLASGPGEDGPFSNSQSVQKSCGLGGPNAAQPSSFLWLLSLDEQRK